MQTKQETDIDRTETTETTAFIFDIQRFSVQDGPGIRTTVFFKGCPLKCLWCSNPESQKRTPELLHRAHMCVQCHRCVEVCPKDAIRVLADESVEVNRELCDGCGACEEACLNDAMRITGKLMSVDEVMDVVVKDMDFYRNSGGGVTASGGEATMQPAFLSELFERCGRRGIHTTLDTCGYVASEILEPILGHVDLLLYDIKTVDPELHRKLTGVSNEIILKNARLIAGKGISMIFRVPLIPESNASLENIQAIAQFAHELGDVEVNLLPYHKFGMGKYEALNMEYRLNEVEALPSEQVERLADEVREYGVPVKVIY